MNEERFVYNTTVPEKVEEIVLPILNGKNPLLREIIEEYTGEFPYGKEVKDFLNALKHTRRKYNIFGLAANQCGINFRGFVIGQGDYDLVCVNPLVIEESEEMKKSKEGCSSFPGNLVFIKRPKWVLVEFYDESGSLVRTKLEGLTARCFLHELEHLNGTVFLDNVGYVAKYLGKKKQKKIYKKITRNR